MLKYLSQIIRVNQAGEYGAKRIYEGQISGLNKDSKLHKLIREMYNQEIEHLNYFNLLLSRKEIRPSILYPFWHMGGFALGYITAFFGDKTAMLCTAAIEQVIIEHYKKQIAFLEEYQGNEDIDDIIVHIKQFLTDEEKHRDLGLEYSSLDNMLAFLIMFVSKISIFLAKRL